MLGILLIEAVLLGALVWATLTILTSTLGFSVAEIDAAVATARRSGLIIAGALMLASALFALALGYYLTRAVNDLRQGAKMIAAGRLGYQIPVRGRDELASTAAAFNGMSARLAELSNEQERTRARLSHLADHDPLTGLMSRRRFHAELDKWIQHAVRYKHHMSLLFLDLDEFKYVNDILGHHVGDRFLVRVAALLMNEMRETDFIGRLGGDEFGILLTETTPKNAELVAKRLLKHLAEADIEIEHQLLHATGSIGIATCPDHSRNVENLLTRADIAMYRAKEKGRNRVHIFTEADEQLDRMKVSMRWEERIKRAFKENRFRLLYQRIIPISGNGTEIYEALLRMEDADGKLILPGEFLETAERFGLIEEIDKHVVRMACEKQIEMKTQGREVHLAINLSGYEFNNIAICDSIKAIIAETGADPTRLIFEITETSALVNIYEAVKFMQKLTSIGCRFALDDFGSGFTSLSYLKIMPINTIKIDGVFVQNMDQNPRDQALVKSMTEMARAMDMQVTAEFVENEETLNLLKQMGVDHAQGYHIGRPGVLH
ncbi:MAG: hypothetical protein BMS9Abin22_218 [Gammaproteobacteria bacterium]|nr:MAG: hypothetical protein BMS9Abin22_218 [Gammaproteobacteria bacterium]